MYIKFLVVLIPKISSIHKNNHICNIHTLEDTGKISVHVTPHSLTCHLFSTVYAYV